MDGGAVDSGAVGSGGVDVGEDDGGVDADGVDDPAVEGDDVADDEVGAVDSGTRVAGPPALGTSSVLPVDGAEPAVAGTAVPWPSTVPEHPAVSRPTATTAIRNPLRMPRSVATHGAGQNADVDRWWRTGVLLTVLSTAAAIAMQAVADQWFPPPVSVSQYGIGPWGWLFSVFVAAMSAAPWCFVRVPAVGSRLARGFLGVGLAGAVVMAAVRTDSGGAQTSAHAKVHMVGSIVCLFFVPLGMLLVLWLRGGGARLAGVLEIAVVEASIVLLLCAAAGWDTAGLGAARSWAFWQAVASVMCVVMVVTIAVVLWPSVSTRDRPRQDHTAATRPHRDDASILVQE